MGAETKPTAGTALRDRLLCTAYHVTYGFIYLGFVLHRSERPWLLIYSGRYLCVLGIMAVPFAAPAALRFLGRRFAIGPKQIAFSVAPASVILAFIYLTATMCYYYRQEHRFDPYVQVAPPRLPRPLSPKEDRTLRILMLGGSTTQCPELPENSKYPTVLSHLLAGQHRNRQIEILNAGRTWYTTRHSLINYVTYYQEWQPDVVIVMHAINDLVRSFSPVPFAVGPYDELYAHYYGAAFAGARPPTFESHLRRKLTPLPLLAFWYSELVPPYRLVDYPVARYVSLGAFERNLRFLIRAVRANGSRAVLITEPTLYKPQMAEDELRALWFARDLCNTPRGFGRYDIPSQESLRIAMAEFNRAVKTVAQEQQIAVVDADAAMEKTLAYFIDDCHYTSAGAKRLAEIVAQNLSDSLVLSR